MGGVAAGPGARANKADATAEALRLGRAHGIRSGKWLINTVQSDEAAIWGAVAKAVYVQVGC